MTKLQELKNKIHELNPSILELKFGCVVKIDEELWQNINEDKYICLDDTQGGFDHYLQTEDYSSDSFDEILGRPITLEDVLFCCVEAYSKFGIITKKSYEEMLGGVVSLWNFSKDFDNQSAEFYDEIMFLLQ